MVAQVGVHGKSKIYNRGAGRQVFNVAFGGKNEYPVVEKIYF